MPGAKLLSKLRALLWRRKLERELDEELAFHRAMLAEKAAGRRRFGNDLRWREAARDAWLFGWIEALGQDLRYALRSLRRAPGYALAVVLTLALGIGANSAIFSLAYGVLWKPLPYPQASRLVDLRQGSGKYNHMQVSAYDVAAARRANTGLVDWAMYRRQSETLTGAGIPDAVDGVEAEAGMYRLLGVRPLLGRLLGPEDDRVGGPSVAMISQQLWQKHWSGDLDIVGRTITLDGKSYTVAGVLPASFHFCLKCDFWLPWQEKLETPGDRDVTVLARLAPGATLKQAQHGLDLEMTRLAQATAADQGWRFIARPLLRERVGDSAPALRLLLGVVGFVLLIAAANIACLLLARTQRREHELATRAALGASRGRIARQLLTETSLLVAAGAGLGLGIAAAGIAWLRSAAPTTLPRLDNLALNWPVVGFTAALALLTGLLFGLAPALGASAPSLQARLKAAPPQAGRRKWLGRRLLIALQVATALVLLVGAGLLLKALDQMMNYPLGFNPDHVLTFELAPSPVAYAKTPARRFLYDRVVQNLEALPGVQGAAIASFLPFSGYATTGYYFPGHPPKPFQDESQTGFNAVTPGYFAALRIPLQTGRLFTAAESTAAPEVAVINQTLARQAFPGENAIGRQIHFLWGQEPLRTVIGIVADTQPDMSVRPGPPPPYAYVPLSQAWAAPWVAAMVRTTGDPNALIPAARRTLAHLDASLPTIQPESLADLFRDAVAAPRFRGDLVAGFAALALLLTAVGLYGLLSYTVGGRTIEFGVRAALGARPGQVMQLVLRQALALVGLGVLTGLAAAWALTRLLSEMLFGVSPTDAGVLAGAVGLVLAVGTVAAMVPARRAMRVDAAEALREG